MNDTNEIELSAVEVKIVYNEIMAHNIEPFKVEYECKCSEFYYQLDDKQYRLIYDQTGDWFCDIIYQGKYK